MTSLGEMIPRIVARITVALIELDVPPLTSDLAFALESLAAFDMFEQRHHVET